MQPIYLTQVMRFKHILPRMYFVQIPFTVIKFCYFTLSIKFTFMTDFIRLILSFLLFGNVLTHLTISVFHHDGRRLVHPAKWSFKNVIHHHDGCRLVHPTKWDILIMPDTIMTDVDWCIPPCGTLNNFGLPSWQDAWMPLGASRHVGHSVYRFNLICQELTNLFTIQLITHMHLVTKHFKYHIFKSICTFAISFQKYTHSI